MRTRLCWLTGLSVLLIAAFAGAARGAIILGSTTPPTGATTLTGCAAHHVIAQYTSDPTTPYRVPAGAVGQITDWATNVQGAHGGEAVRLVVIAPQGGADFDVVGVDAETVPTPVPAGGVATFTLPTPIQVTGGEMLGLYTTTTTCLWSGGATPTGDALLDLAEPATPATGQTLIPAAPNGPGGNALNVAAALQIFQDAAVTTAAGPINASVGNMAVLSSTIVNDGPSSTPITFVDNVPKGLTIDAVAAGPGACATNHQQVACTISGLAPGRSAPVTIVVTPSAAQKYTNKVSVAVPPGTTDSTPGNDTSSAKLAAAPAPQGARCIVPTLTGTPIRIAKHLLTILGCKVGRVRHFHSAFIAKGAVIRTVPRPRTYPLRTVVALAVSRGP